MTAKEVKKQLREYRRNRDECERLKKRVKNKEADMNYLRAIVSSGMTRSSNISDTVERTIEVMDGLLNRYALKILACEETETRILDLIDLAPEGLCRDILELHYIEGRKFEDIPEIIKKSRNTMWKYYNIAIARIGIESD